MNDNPGPLLDHGGKQTAVQSNGRIQVFIDGLLPELIRDGNESAARGRRSPDVMDNNVHTIIAAQHLADDMRRALGGRDVRLDEMRRRVLSGGGPRRYRNGCASLQKAVRDGPPRALGAAGHQDTFAVEFTRAV